MNMKNTCSENSNLRLEQSAAMKAGFCGIDQEQLSAEKAVAEAAKTGRKRRRVAQAGTSTSDGSYEAGAF